MYSQSEIENRKQAVLDRAGKILDKISPSLLKCQLLTYCYGEVYDEELAMEAHSIIDSWGERRLSDEEQEIEVISYKYDRLQKQSMETSTVGKKLISLTKKNRLEDSQLPTDKTWHSIMTEVDKIYPQFYSLLKEAFPNLTESEYQYCYLHIFGFDANDEAKLLGINPDSIRMKRTRIKQKLEKQVDEGISLRDYLIKYLVK